LTRYYCSTNAARYVTQSCFECNDTRYA